MELSRSVVVTATTPTTVLDVRTPAEYKSGYVKGARNLNYEGTDFKTEVAKLDRNGSYKVYCQKGGRAEMTVAVMREMGFKDVENIGGLQDAAKKLKTVIEK